MIFYDSNMTTFVHYILGDESQHHNKFGYGSNLSVVEKEIGTHINEGLFVAYFLPFALLALSSFSNVVSITVMSVSGLDSVKTTSILFWVFLLGSPVLWLLSAIFEEMILPKSTKDKFLLAACGICTTSESYFYITAAQLLYPTVLSVVETIGIPVFFIVQIVFLQNISGPENLWLQVASIIIVFLISVGLLVLEILRGSSKGNEEGDHQGY